MGQIDKNSNSCQIACSMFDDKFSTLCNNNDLLLLSEGERERLGCKC